MSEAGLETEGTGPRRGADVVVECLAAEGIGHVFGLPGTTVMDLIDALARQDAVRYLSTRHEQVAGFMADGYSRASRIPGTPGAPGTGAGGDGGGGGLGVCLASRGPGAANLSIAVQNAHDESVPVLVLIGQVPGSVRERRSFEEMDVVSAFRPFCKWAVEIHDGERIPELLQRAVRTALGGRPGPVVVSLPLDVLQAQVSARPGPRVRIRPPAPDPDGVEEAARLLAGAERPVIVVGGGATGAPEAHLALADAAGAPLVTTWLRKNAVPNSSPAFLGALGYGAHDVTDRLVREADVVVALGCRFSEFTTKRWTLVPSGAALVHADIDPEELGRVHPPRVGLVSDAAAASRALAAAVGVLAQASGAAGDLAARRAQRRADLREEFEKAAEPAGLLGGSGGPAADGDGGPVGTRGEGEGKGEGDGAADGGTVTSLALTRAVRGLAEREGVVLVQDVHTFGPWVQRHVSFDRPHSYYGSAGGAMAWGFPAAMGMATARPGVRVVALSGDGSFWMVAQDFETCVREDIPVVNVVVNNFSYGNTRDRQRFAHGGRYSGVFLGNPDFAAYARLLGGHGVRVTSDDEVLPAIEEALAQPGPAIVDIVQSETEGLPEGLEPPKAR
ncbi:thiamine pyrophosphate-binding protein [Streptomyces sp. HNM0575]|uniref:thiamine pyrophosphate-binding protein n=1 Tax=Streptomyces sp. HNM0575 TaxID=2716338 RepID=UPI00145FC060|nr:thiamine pyrophosphate-binding protein [Streptomyces sp. HNM0575]NLU74319.1 thiamine pyrophosphate-binding protein [Streptomyces sp. HNM0575]